MFGRTWSGSVGMIIGYWLPVVNLSAASRSVHCFDSVLSGWCGAD